MIRYRVRHLAAPAAPSCFFAARFPGGFFLARHLRRFAALLAVVVQVAAAGCSSTPETPYPAFIQIQELPDAFLAGLPGVRAKLLAGNPETRRSSTVLTLPAGWQFTTGGFPDKSVEMFVMAGSLKLGDLDLRPGGYAYLPAGGSGIELASGTGAELLYFLDDVMPDAVIQTPLVLNAADLAWESTDDVAAFGYATKELRGDPGSGTRTWLLRILPGASPGWRRSAVPVEGFLLSGQYRHGECVGGEVAVGEYAPGGYFLRPAGVIHGGPDAGAVEASVWYLRRADPGDDQPVAGCAAAAANDALNP